MNNNIAALSINSAVSIIVAQILTRTATVDSMPASTADTGIILNPLFQLINRAAPMDINLNQLLNSAVLQSTVRQLPAELLAKPQVIEALVLSNTLLPASSPSSNASATNPAPISIDLPPTLELPVNYRISLQWQNRVLQFLSPQPLPTGRTVQLQINARGEVLLLPPTTMAKNAGAQRSAPTASLTNALLSPTATTNTSAAKSPATPLQTLQQSLRETLPKQEPLHTLMPLLQKLLSPTIKNQLPPLIGKMVEQLLKSLPKPTQLQSAEGVKRALENSGSFLEARIAKVNSAGNTAEPLTKVLTTDLKAQLTALLNIVRKLIPNSETVAQNAGAEHPIANQDDELVYNPKQILRNSQNPAQRSDDADQGDLQLGQLSKLLQAGLARIQLNQLDSAVSRHNTSETQPQVPAWVLELPIPTPRGSENLQLRIEQHCKQQDSRTRVQWTVQIAFDLHELGKLAATLSIVEKSVAATLWAERANTHRNVQEKIDYLRVGLESVGVKVTEMQCRLGLPPVRTALVSQQLVDVHT